MEKEKKCCCIRFWCCCGNDDDVGRPQAETKALFEPFSKSDEHRGSNDHYSVSGLEHVGEQSSYQRDIYAKNQELELKVKTQKEELQIKEQESDRVLKTNQELTNKLCFLKTNYEDVDKKNKEMQSQISQLKEARITILDQKQREIDELKKTLDYKGREAKEREQEESQQAQLADDLLHTREMLSSANESCKRLEFELEQTQSQASSVMAVKGDLEKIESLKKSSRKKQEKIDKLEKKARKIDKLERIIKDKQRAAAQFQKLNDTYRLYLVSDAEVYGREEKEEEKKRVQRLKVALTDPKHIPAGTLDFVDTAKEGIECCLTKRMRDFPITYDGVVIFVKEKSGSSPAWKERAGVTINEAEEYSADDVVKFYKSFRATCIKHNIYNPKSSRDKKSEK